MSKRVLLKGLQPKRFVAALRRRGIGGLTTHSMRRVGTMMGTALTGPAVIRINPMGFVCNHACPMCWLQHLDQEELKKAKKADIADNLKLDDYVRLLDSMPTGLEEVNVVGGGEPLVHKQCVDIMRAIKSRKLRGSLISNGSLLKQPVADALLDMRWDSLRVSVHGGDPEAYKAIQGVDHFDTVRRNLTYFTEQRRALGRERDCGLVVFHVIQHENIPHLERLFQFAEDVGADQMVLEKIIPYDSGKWLSKDELRSASEQIRECSERFRITFNKDAILGQLHHEEVVAEVEGRPWVPAKRCSVGFDEAFIDAMGNVLPCCFSNDIMGNIRESSFAKIWQSPQYRAFRGELMNGEFRGYCISNRCHLPNVLHD
ncbi:radical SAM protein [bacterium]|nr:radical SAM protein [bacterium]